MKLTGHVAKAVRSWSPCHTQPLRTGRWKGEEKASVVHAKSRGLAALEELQQEKREEALGRRTVITDKVEFKRPLKVVSYPDPRLRSANARIKLPAKGVEELAEEMFHVMYKDDGIGLAAPQVGVNVQMMVFNPEGHEARGDKSKEVVLINPRIIKMGSETEVDEEGCLSFYQPVYIRGDVERAFSIQIKALNLQGEKVSYSLEGLPARIFQHEYDHLQGILFFERMTPAVLDLVRSDLKRYEEEFQRKNPGVKIERCFP